MKKKDIAIDVEVYVLVSSEGYVAPFAGYSHSRKVLVSVYKNFHGHTPQQGGYRIQKARLTSV